MPYVIPFINHISFHFRHMNIDYAICQALAYHTDGLTEGLVEYDVGCQWSINFEKRLENSTTLHLPQGLSWIAAVGKFHLGTHEQDCFAKFSLNFVHGAGQQDGEILETLWAPLNKIAGSVRAMTKASRQEMVDAQMRDSNWKKSTKIGAVLFLPFSSGILYSCCIQSKAPQKNMAKLARRRKQVMISLMSWTPPLILQDARLGPSKRSWQ